MFFDVFSVGSKSWSLVDLLFWLKPKLFDLPGFAKGVFIILGLSNRPFGEYVFFFSGVIKQIYISLLFTVTRCVEVLIFFCLVQSSKSL